jgi:MFS family permease
VLSLRYVVILTCCKVADCQSMIQLIVFRAIQGMGGGGVLTLAMIIISDVVSLKERGKYQGITGVVVVLSNSCGPIIGGLLTERVSWRWCFVSPRTLGLESGG